MVSIPPTVSNSQSDPASRPWGLIGWTIVVGAFAIGFWQFPLRVVGPEMDHLPGDIVDARFNNYILEHGYRYLNGQDAAFWDVDMFYPTPRVVAYSDAHIGMLPVYASARGLGASPERAFQIWFLVPFALNYASAIVASRRLNATFFAAIVTAYFFTFGINQVTSLTLHAQFGPRFLVPLALVFAWEWLQQPSVRKLAYLAACVIGQTYLTIYIGYFLVLVVLLQSLVAVGLERRALPWSALIRAGYRGWLLRGVVAVLALLTVLPLAMKYVSTSNEHFVPGPGDVRGTHPTPHAWVYSSRVSVHAVWTDIAFPPWDGMPDHSEKQLFPGLLPFFALVGGVIAFACSSKFRRGYQAVTLVTVLICVVVVTNIFGVPLYEPVLYLPGAGGIRTIARIVHVLAFPWGFFVGQFLERWIARVPKYRIFAVFLMLAVVIADQWVVSTDGSSDWRSYHFSVAEAQVRRERMTQVIRQHPNPRLIYVFPEENEHEMYAQVDAMAATQSLGIPTVNGWSAYPPFEWAYFADCESLVDWLKVKHNVGDEMLEGLVLIGEPAKAINDREMALRTRFFARPRPR